MAVKATAEVLGNTPAVCRNYYIHPAVIAAYEAGTLLPLRAKVAARRADYQELDLDEATVLALLEAAE